MKRSMLIIIAFINVVPGPAQAAPLSTSFTYQGRLTENGQLANGIYDFQFRLFDAPTNGAQVPIVLGYPTVPVTNGLFTTGLDFGSNVFNGTTWWLDISLRPSSTFGEFIFLSPRQPLTPTPNALFSVNAAQAATATSASGVVASAISSAQLNTPSGPVGGQVLSFNGTSLVWTNASTAAAAWILNGNAGTAPGVNFLGTTDNEALELKAHNNRALRIEPLTANGAFNIIGGASINFVDGGVIGATIGGGGATNYLGFVETNQIWADFGTISGGLGNAIGGNARYATIGGGAVNLIQLDAHDATVGGGFANTIEDGAGTSTIAGGSANRIQASSSTICGGFNNIIRTGSSGSTLGGGSAHSIEPDAPASTIGGGEHNRIQTDAYDSTIGGGRDNTVLFRASYSTIAGGSSNSIQGFGLDGNFSSIGGGVDNRALDAVGTIAGGQGNQVQSYGAVGGGLSNSAAQSGVVAGGGFNTIVSGTAYSVIGGGNGNIIQDRADFSTIAGGKQNLVITQTGNCSIGGGVGNVAAGFSSTIPGGNLNTAAGSYSLSAGRRGKALDEGAFVWADSSDFDFASAATNEFAARATGGVRFVSGVDNNGVPVAGVSLPAGGGSWATLSDRNAKTHFTPVNPRELLDRLAQLPIQSWNYKSQSESVRHIGPTAQDFHSAFTVGEDDQHIAAVDADGVALAAIQGLNQKLEAELNRRDAEIQALRQQLTELKTALGKQTSPAKGGPR